MSRRHLNIGKEPNKLNLLIEDIEIKPYANINNGLVYKSIEVTLPRYHLEDVLTQMLEDYGEDELIKRIKNIT